jgi:anti-sigma factor RsiW
MPCKHYKEALIEAAAGGLDPRGELRAHLDACAPCRAAFEQEQSLFASIDAGLHVAANAEVPPSLLPRLRARMGEAAAPQRRWFQPWVFAAASVALVLAIFLFARPHHSRPDDNDQAKQTPQIPIRGAPATNAGPQNSGPPAQIVSSSANNSRARVHSTLLGPVASSQPEVLVPPDEREAFSSFVAVLGERRELALALVTPAPQTKDESASLEPLQINGLEIKPLAATGSEQSDGAKQEQ